MTPFDPRLTLIAQEAKVKTCHCFHTYSAIKEMGRQFHIGAFAAFAGLEERHVTAIIEALAAHDALPGKAARAPREATRISPNWQPSDDDIAYAREKKCWDDATIEIEAETFRNYWSAKSGKEATKVDWSATWRNRVISQYSAPTGYCSSAFGAKKIMTKAEIGRAIEFNKAQGNAARVAELEAMLESNVLQFKGFA